MRLLDLFCGAGGAAMGYHRAGFDEIVGIDIVPQPRYPFAFIKGDALRPPVRLEDFDLIHASPPCQRYSTATSDYSKHPDLVASTRRLISERPHVIENVQGAPLAALLVLCGSMFGMEIQRHRHFELSFAVLAPGCNHKAWQAGRPFTVTGNGAKVAHRHSLKYHDLDHARTLMGMPWCQTQHEVTEAIPPAYTEYIGRQFLDQQARSMK